ncbi:hypothetical protein SYNTR_0996 [Candidatus Syntrophocurvum alkaliphilum]|uniref:PPC domain-containing protein n=1 Tax=Candidatus Syntrophocurvum alkaliphilum TaxID=2293317 RepID=A0A6I6DBA1_9FIRM|nr:PPC domain-containing DNA-binding protein [Candidatus Syntrophocurvum alkaliphilum]QGT99589.1 hypothetical protein SYNTR_0996 [Candidatus Syntrophocurvum alkaliphilum]
MQYTQGSMGRVFVIKFEHGDNLIEQLQLILNKEQITTGTLLMIGALKKSKMVVGPEECVVPPVVIPYIFEDGREIAAIGTIFPDENGNPVFHIHSSVGRQNDSIVGCLRDDTEVYLIVEAVIIEFLNIDAKKVFEEKYDLNMLKIDN